MKKVFEVKEKCQACKGTGVYIGMAERDGAGVVCSKCKGTGCFHFKHEYEEFDGIEMNPNVERVFETNPGIVIGTDREHKLEDFGGLTYKDWLAGKPFPEKSENRKYTCPKWWAQFCGENGPQWKECFENLGKMFPDCKYFPVRHKCWEKWDMEQADKEGV